MYRWGASARQWSQLCHHYQTGSIVRNDSTSGGDWLEDPKGLSRWAKVEKESSTRKRSIHDNETYEEKK